MLKGILNIAHCRDGVENSVKPSNRKGLILLVVATVFRRSQKIRLFFPLEKGKKRV